MIKKALIFLAVSFVVVVVFFIFYLFLPKNNVDELAPQKIKPVEILSPSLMVDQDPVAPEIKWEKAFQKIEEEKARLVAENKIVELSKFEALAYQCKIVDEQAHIIRDAKSWDQLLRRMEAGRATSLFPEIDFNTSMIAAVFTGDKPFNDKLLLIDSHEFEKSGQSKKLVISYRRQFAPKGSTISSIMMQPYHLKVFPLFVGSVEFREK